MTMRARFTGEESRRAGGATRGWGRTPADVLLAGIAVLAVMGGTLTPRAEAQPQPRATSAPPSAFTYDGTGRRDPFVSLALRGSDPRSEGRLRYQGLTGVSVGEVTVKGIVLFEGKLVAMVQAPDDRTYIVRANDRLLDGAVRAVTAEAVVFVQQVNDPLSLVKEREIRKPLRVVEEVK
jgi:Tfp pilus assembly protein PilP